MPWKDGTPKHKVKEYSARAYKSLKQNKQKWTEYKEKRYRSVTYRWNAHVQNAKNRGLANELTKEEWLKLTQEDCYYCHCTSNYGFSGVDRVDNTHGYTTENTVSCCGQCNWEKGTKTEREWFDKMLRVLAIHNKI